jgi:hypothetical protein
MSGWAAESNIRTHSLCAPVSGKMDGLDLDYVRQRIPRMSALRIPGYSIQTDAGADLPCLGILLPCESEIKIK